MGDLHKLLSPLNLTIDQLLLDPNNPRFAELSDDFEPIVERRFAEATVQDKALERMKAKNFDVLELRDTIKTLGFLPMDKIVVRKWADSSDAIVKYVIVEGNRRVAALKWLLALNAEGKENLIREQIDNFEKLEVLLLDDTSSSQFAKWVLPGLRHVSGIKSWGPYQRARTVFALREAGNDAQTAAQSLGLSTRAANQLWRSYLALEQMKRDEEYGEKANTRLYSHFEEVFRKTELKDWLEWSDTERKFTNLPRIREFYSWIVGSGDEGEEAIEPKLQDSKLVRELGKIINDESAMSVFRQPEGSITRATARFITEHPDDWRPTIESAFAVLKSMPADTLRFLSEEERSLLTSLMDKIGSVIRDHSLLNAENNELAGT